MWGCKHSVVDSGNICYLFCKKNVFQLMYSKSRYTLSIVVVIWPRCCNLKTTWKRSLVCRKSWIPRSSAIYKPHTQTNGLPEENESYLSMTLKELQDGHNMYFPLPETCSCFGGKVPENYDNLTKYPPPLRMNVDFDLKILQR